MLNILLIYEISIFFYMDCEVDLSIIKQDKKPNPVRFF